MVYLLFKDQLEKLKSDKEAMRAAHSAKVKWEIKMKYIIPEVEVPIALQLNYYKEVVEICSEERVAVPHFARKKTEFLKRLNKRTNWVFFAGFVIFLASVFLDAFDGSRSIHFSARPLIGIFSFFILMIIMMLFNDLLVLQCEADEKRKYKKI